MKKAPGQPDWPIIDMHCHVYGKGAVDAAGLVAGAREMGVRRMALLGDVIAFGYHPTAAEIRSINDATAETALRYPDVFIPFCFVNPENPPEGSREEIRRRIREQGFRGVKLLATVNARDLRLDPIMREARELGVPVVHHSWYNTLGESRDESTPADIAELGGRFPEVRIVMAHLGGARVRGVLDIEGRPNISVDTSGSQPIGELIEYAVQILGADRIVYGSDAPGRDFSAQLGRIRGARLSEADRRKILYRNAERLLALEGE